MKPKEMPSELKIITDQETKFYLTRHKQGVMFNAVQGMYAVGFVLTSNHTARMIEWLEEVKAFLVPDEKLTAKKKEIEEKQITAKV